MMVLYPLNRKLPTPKMLSTAFKRGTVFQDEAGKVFTINCFLPGDEVKLIANNPPKLTAISRRSSISVKVLRSVTLRIQKGQTNAA